MAATAASTIELYEAVERGLREIARFERTDTNWKASIAEFGPKPLIVSLRIVTGLPEGLIRQVADLHGLDLNGSAGHAR